MESQFSDLPPRLFEVCAGEVFVGRDHPHLHVLRFMEFVVCGLIHRIHRPPVNFAGFWDDLSSC